VKTLLILRHAKSSWQQPGQDDHDRPLNDRGKRDAPRMGRLLADEDRVPDLILSSTARRARRTAEIVAEACGYDGEIVLCRDFYDAEPEAYLEAVRARGGSAERVMVVGHNPILEMLVEHLTGRAETMPTAALAEVALPIDGWEALDEETRGRLVRVWRPRELGA